MRVKNLVSISGLLFIVLGLALSVVNVYGASMSTYYKPHFIKVEENGVLLYLSTLKSSYFVGEKFQIHETVWFKDIRVVNGFFIVVRVFEEPTGVHYGIYTVLSGLPDGSLASIGPGGSTGHMVGVLEKPGKYRVVLAAFKVTNLKLVKAMRAYYLLLSLARNAPVFEKFREVATKDLEELKKTIGGGSTREMLTKIEKLVAKELLKGTSKAIQLNRVELEFQVLAGEVGNEVTLGPIGPLLATLGLPIQLSLKSRFGKAY